MAINDISLTAGMRANLVNLQGTVDLLNRTQDRLSTGKKVNSALDNPTSFFTAQAHMQRASDIAALKDAMGESIQTIKAADAGIKSLTALLESAKALAQSALQASPNQVKVSVGTISAGTVITVGGTAYTATSASTAGANEFTVSSTDPNTTASNLAALINATIETTNDMTASVSGNVVTLQTKSTSAALTVAADFAVGGTNFTVDATVTSNRADLGRQYNTLIAQLDAVAYSSGYKGTNLLANNNLSVTFENTTLTVQGFSATASDLGANSTSTYSASGSSTFPWSVSTDIQADITKVDVALGKLRTEGSKLSQNLSIINVRLDFSNNMIKTLSEGADKLTLADMNEEGANMLMLQTRQALGTTALSLSSQAAQSVLRLF